MRLKIDRKNITHSNMGKIKKEKPQKTEQERQEETYKLMDQFLELGFSIEHPSTQQFLKIAKEFKEHGWSAQGILRFREYERNMYYLFTNQPHIASSIQLKFTGQLKPKIDIVRT